MDRETLEALLERIGDNDPEAQQELLDYIMQQREGIRVLALEALEDGGEDTFEQLLLTLVDDPELVVRPARRRPSREDTIDTSGLHPIAQQAAREWQQQVAAEEAPQELLDALRGGDRHERVRAARALAGIADPNTVEPLIEAIRSDDRLVAGAAVEALQEIGKAAVPALIETLKAPDEQARWHAAKALSTIGDRRAAEPLVQALEDPNYGVRWLAAEGLARTGRAALAPLFRRLAEEKSSAWLRQGAWHVLNKIDLQDDEARRRYKQVGAEIRRSSAAATPTLARRELEHLGEEL